MKNLKRQILFILIFIGILLITNRVFAASATITPSSTNVTTGTTVNITVGVQSAETWLLHLTSNGGTLSGTKDTTDAMGAEVTKNVMSATFVANTPGSYTITLSGNVAGSDLVKQNINKPITITVSNPAPKPSPTPPPAPTFSNASGTVYTTQLSTFRSSYSTSSKSLGQIPAGTALTRVAVSNSKVDGYYWTRVTYNGTTGYVASSLLTTTKPTDEPTTTPTPTGEEKSNDATLKSLSIEGIELTPAFDPNVTSYTANIGENITSVQVVAEVNNEKAKYEVTGNTELNNEENILTVTVTAEDGTVMKYEIKLTKGAQVVPSIEPSPIASENSKTEKVDLKINFKLILIIGLIVVITIVGITFAVLYYKNQGGMEYAKPDYSFLKNDEDIQNKEKERKQTKTEENNIINDIYDERRGGKHF